MPKTISRKARHRAVHTFVLFHSNFFQEVSKKAYVSVEDARDAAKERVVSLSRRLGVGKSYWTYETLTMQLISASKRTRKAKSQGPY